MKPTALFFVALALFILPAAARPQFGLPGMGGMGNPLGMMSQMTSMFTNPMGAMGNMGRMMAPMMGGGMQGLGRGMGMFGRRRK